MNTQDLEVYSYLNSIKVSYSVVYSGCNVNDKQWPHYAFTVTFTNGKASESFPFKVGTGHCKSFTVQQKAARTKWLKERKAHGELLGGRGFVQLSEQNAWVTELLDKPTAASVLYCLLLDAQANQESFSSWCDNFGYDSDSISALNTYQACEKIAKQLHNIFTREQLAHLDELLQDY